MGFLQLENKKFLVFGIANRKSVAYFSAKALLDEGAQVIASVYGDEQYAAVKKLFPDMPVYKCDVSSGEDIEKLAIAVSASHGTIHGILHSVAFANYSEGMKSFHETVKKDFLQAVDISCFSFISIARYFKDFMDKDGAMVTVSISTTRMAAENYGYMAPVKAALDSSIVFLAKSLSSDTNIRVNGVGASLLKTSASAGIPGYIEPYLFAEKATLRKKALMTEEVANTIAFLLSPRSSGINAQTIVVDAGMSVNYFDRAIVSSATR